MDPIFKSQQPAVAPEGASAPTTVPHQNPTTEPALARADVSALSSPRSHAILLVTAIVGLTTDLVTKHLAFQNLWFDHPKTIVGGVLSFNLSLNPGALFGIGKGLSPLFILASMLAVGFVAYMFVTSQRRQWVVHLALGLVLAGALGNLYDRVFVKVDVVPGFQPHTVITQIRPDGRIQIGDYPDGHRNVRSLPGSTHVETRTAVRDFICFEASFREKSVWPWIFNIADSMLVVGVGLLLIIYWRHPVAPQAANAPAQRQEP